MMSIFKQIKLFIIVHEFIAKLHTKGQQISKVNYGFKTFSKKQTKLTVLEDYYLKVNTKREYVLFARR